MRGHWIQILFFQSQPELNPTSPKQERKKSIFLSTELIELFVSAHGNKNLLALDSPVSADKRNPQFSTIIAIVFDWNEQQHLCFLNNSLSNVAGSDFLFDLRKTK